MNKKTLHCLVPQLALLRSEIMSGPGYKQLKADEGSLPGRPGMRNHSSQFKVRHNIVDPYKQQATVFVKLSVLVRLFFLNVHYTEPPPAYASHPKATIATVPTAAEVRCSQTIHNVICTPEDDIEFCYNYQ